MDMLSPHFSYAEGTISESAPRLGIDNTPSQEILRQMQNTASYLEKVRDLLGNPIHVNSFYRSPALNAAIGGVPTSQHCKGEAADIICPQYGSCYDICKAIIAAGPDAIPFDQLILEHTWVHISFLNPGSTPRGQVLSLLATGHYASGLTDKNGVPLQ